MSSVAQTDHFKWKRRIQELITEAKTAKFTNDIGGTGGRLLVSPGFPQKTWSVPKVSSLPWSEEDPSSERLHRHQSGYRSAFKPSCRPFY